jgi:hypothetical protein
MSSKNAFTMIFYIISDDLDDIEQPNAFGYIKKLIFYIYIYFIKNSKKCRRFNIVRFNR